MLNSRGICAAQCTVCILYTEWFDICHQRKPRFGLASSTLGSSVLSFMVNGERMSEIVVLILVLHEKLPQTARNALRLNAQ